MSRYKEIQIRLDGAVAYLKLNRIQNNNTITLNLIEELHSALTETEEEASIIVVEGGTTAFCTGADFKTTVIDDTFTEKSKESERLYEFWLRLNEGKFISVAHVQGRVNAGGIGFVAACDIVISDINATFALSELLFGLYPACVLPFLIKRIGFQRANLMTLTTKPIDAKLAVDWQLVDFSSDNSERLLAVTLGRLKKLSKNAVSRYKQYRNNFSINLRESKAIALQGNLETFSEDENIKNIRRYVNTGCFPWE